MKNKGKLIRGNSFKILKKMKSNSIHSIVCDPPYGLSFMGKDWDKALPPTKIWKECLRVLKPGGYIIAMSSPRTYHRLAVQLEDLGFITHPQIIWIFGSGFPKATDLSKQFDKQAGIKIKSDYIAQEKNDIYQNGKGKARGVDRTPGVNLSPLPSTELAKKYEGYKYGLQSLKPALEPIYVGQKPWKNKHIKRMTENVEKYGVGAFNIDACRVEGKLEGDPNRFTKAYSMGDGHEGYKRKAHDNYEKPIVRNEGRHPANLLHDGSESVEKEFLNQSGDLRSRHGYTQQSNTGGGTGNCYVMDKKGKKVVDPTQNGNLGSCSRYFNSLPITKEDLIPFNYIAKASKKERNEGLEGMEERKWKSQIGADSYTKETGKILKRSTKRLNHHPCVKPIKLMEWLVKLITPKDGICLDPFMGSGTTGIVCKKLGFNFIGIELKKVYFKIAKARIKNTIKPKKNSLSKKKIKLIKR